MRDNETLTSYQVTVMPRNKEDGATFNNLYLYIGEHRFEIVPHCFTIREKAYFYGLVSRTADPKPNKSDVDQKKL